MRFRDSHRPDVLVASSEGHGYLALLGLPFLLAGLAVIGAGLGLLPVDGSPGLLGRAGIVAFGAVFAAVGLGLVAGRSALVVDRGRGTLVVWYGLLGPMWRREHRLDDLARVAVRTDTSGDSTSYAVGLVRTGGVVTAVANQASYLRARAVAERLALFLELPLADDRSGREVVRAADELEVPLAERLRRAPVPSVGPPPLTRIRVERRSDGLVVELPPRGVGPGEAASVVLSLAFVGAVGWLFVRPLLVLPMPEPLRLAFLSFIGLFFVVGPLGVAVGGVLRAAVATTRVELSSEALRVRHRAPLRHRVEAIPRAELEELELPDLRLADAIRRNPDGTVTVDEPALETIALERSVPGARGRPGPRSRRVLARLARRAPGLPLTARGDAALLEIGHGLSPDELRYLHALLARELARDS